MFDRRNFVSGSAALALLLVPSVGLPSDPAEVRLLDRVRGLYAEHRRRSARMAEGFRRGVGLGVDGELLAALSEGMSWAGVVATLASERTEDLVHPAFQTVLRQAAEAVGSTVATLRQLLGSVTVDAIDDDAFEKVFVGVTQAVDVPDEDPVAIELLRGVGDRLRRDLAKRGVARVIGDETRRLDRIQRIAEHVATGRSGLLESQDPALLAAVARGQLRWGESSSTAGPSAGQIVGSIALGLLAVGGAIALVALAAGAASCVCVSIPIILLALTVLVVAGWGIVAILNEPAWRPRAAVPELHLLTLLVSGWQPLPPLPPGKRYELVFTGTLQADSPPGAFGPTGNPREAAPAGCPVMAGQFGAAVVRGPGYPDGAAIRGAGALPLPFAEGYEVGVNVPPGTTLSGPGFSVFARAIP